MCGASRHQTLECGAECSPPWFARVAFAKWQSSRIAVGPADQCHTQIFKDACASKEKKLKGGAEGGDISQGPHQGILLTTQCTAVNYIKIKLAITQAETSNLTPFSSLATETHNLN